MTLNPTNETHERSHYDEAMYARVVGYIAEHSLSIGEFAERVGIDRSMASKYVNKTNMTTTTVEAALKSFFAKQERVAVGAKFVPTRVSMAVIEACEYAFDERKMVILYGPPQIGKTTGAQEFMRRKIANGNRSLIYVTANSTTTPFSLIRRTCEELGIPLTGCTPELLERVLAKLKRDPHLIVVDDASYLNVKALEALRYLYDQAGCGIVLMGVRTLMERVFHASGRLAEDLEQLYSRVNLQKYLPGAGERKDGAQLEKELRQIAARTKLPEKIIDQAIELVREPRALLNVLDRVKYLRELNPGADVKEIVAQAHNEVFRAA